MSILGVSTLTRGAAGGMGIEVQMDPSPVILLASFNKLGQDIRSFREPLTRSIREVVAPSLQQNFKELGRPDKWKEVTENTHRRKSAQGFQAVAMRPLHRTGKLMKTAGQLNIWNIDGQEGLATLEVPDSVWYGRVHQEGSGSVIGQWLDGTDLGTPGYVPQRIWALLQEEDINDIEEVFAKWLDERVEANLR